MKKLVLMLMLLVGVSSATPYITKDKIYIKEYTIEYDSLDNSNILDSYFKDGVLVFNNIKTNYKSEDYNSWNKEEGRYDLINIESQEVTIFKKLEKGDKNLFGLGAAAVKCYKFNNHTMVMKENYEKGVLKRRYKYDHMGRPYAILEYNGLFTLQGVSKWYRANGMVYRKKYFKDNILMKYEHYFKDGSLLTEIIRTKSMVTSKYYNNKGDLIATASRYNKDMSVEYVKCFENGIKVYDHEHSANIIQRRKFLVDNCKVDEEVLY